MKDMIGNRKIRKMEEGRRKMTEIFKLELINQNDRLGDCTNVTWFKSNTGIVAARSVDDTPHGPLNHVSVSRADRLPSWDEVKRVRDLLLPSYLDFMMVLPNCEDYVNIHEYCFHLWQIPEKWGIR